MQLLAYFGLSALWASRKNDGQFFPIRLKQKTATSKLALGRGTWSPETQEEHYVHSFLVESDTSLELL